MPKVAQYKEKFVDSLKTGVIGGLEGGVPIGILFALTKSPAISSILGSIIGSAFEKDATVRKIIAVNGTMDGIVSLFTVGK